MHEIIKTNRIDPREQNCFQLHTNILTLAEGAKAEATANSVAMQRDRKAILNTVV